MKSGIIGLPQVGKTSLFRILTKAKSDSFGHANSREAHLGIARVPDVRLDKLAALANARKIVHVLRAFEDDTIPHVGPIDPLRDIGNVEIDLIVSDLTQIEKRLERVAKDMKKAKTPETEREHALLLRCKAQTEAGKPLREMEMTAEEKKLIRGFVFLSQKPILYVLNISESSTLGADLDAAVEKYGLTEVASRPNSGATAICGKVEAELAEMDDDEAAEFLEGYGLSESGLVRLIRKSYELLGLVSFFTFGEPETRAWTIPVNCRAQEAAGAIHSDLEKHFIRAETIHWDALLADRRQHLLPHLLQRRGKIT